MWNLTPRSSGRNTAELVFRSKSPGPVEVISILNRLRVFLRQIAYIIALDAVLSLWKFDLLTFDDQVCAKDTSSNLSAVLTMADVTTSLLAEQVVIIDLDSHSLAKTGSFHFGYVYWYVSV